MTTPGRAWGIQRSAAEIAQALERMEQGNATLSELAECATTPLGWGDTLGWQFCLGELSARGLVRFAAVAGGMTLATLTPTTPRFTLRPWPDAFAQRLVLSRFAYLRRDGEELILESPCSPARVVITDARAVALLAHVTVPRTAAAIADLVGDGMGLVELLWGAGMLVDAAAEEGNVALAHWEFHDLLFHARSRSGRHQNPFGGTYRFVGRFAPEPPLKPTMTGETSALPTPDLERLLSEDLPYARVQESRQSLRRHGRSPLCRAQLGEFLFRVARVKQRKSVPVDTPRGKIDVDFAMRPYPGGGALYEQEFYLAIDRCQDVDPGLYHYEAADHQLRRLSGQTPPVARMLDSVRWMLADKQRPQILLLIAARVPRFSWKYQSMAYSAILKNVGVVMQTMYLAATAMGLAPCAVGGGDSDLFVEATGIDYYRESLVGEFVLGSRPEEDRND
jgi:SagB-type dehydrogenase family enzyme